MLSDKLVLLVQFSGFKTANKRAQRIQLAQDPNTLLFSESL